MKPYQINLFTVKEKLPEIILQEPTFVYENKRYINFSLFDCRNLRNNEYLKETLRLNLDSRGITMIEEKDELMIKMKEAMQGFKKLEALAIYPDETTAALALSSIFDPKTVFFVDYETSPSIKAVLGKGNVEYYHHQDIEQLTKLLAVHSEKAIIIDGLYEWLGYSGPINEMVKVAKETGATIIANEMNSFGLLGREGRGFVDLYYLYDDVNIEIGCFDKFIGGFGAYIGAKKYLINRIIETTNGIYKLMPNYIIALNLAGIELLMSEKNSKAFLQKLWSHSRYFINRLKQLNLRTKSETPIIVVMFNNNDEAEEFATRLLYEGVVVQQQKERVRFTLSIEHSKSDLDYTLNKVETIIKEMGHQT